MPLTINPSGGPSPTTSTSPPSQQLYHHQEREPSPEPPPASPLTPVAQPAKPATLKRPDQPAQFIQQPPALPFSADDSSDAIALRAAISSLQFQRLRAQQDLRTLEEIKRQAVEHPEEYKRHITSSSIQKSAPAPWKTQAPLHQDEDAVTGAASLSAEDSGFSEEQLLSEASRSYGSMLHPQQPKTPNQPPNFPSIPLPQDVVRCPPIEWAKYNIVGDSLDKLHRDQQLHPGDADSAERDNVVAGPYNPFLDKLDAQPASKESTPNRKDSVSAPAQPAQRRRSSKVAL